MPDPTDPTAPTDATGDQAAIEISEPPELTENEGTAEGTSVEEQWETARSMDGQAPTG